MDFAEQTLKAIQQLLRDGYKSPFHMAQVGRNGVMSYHRFTVRDDPQQGLGLDAEMLATYPQDEETEMGLPINQLWVDARGATQHVTIDDHGGDFRFSPN